MSNRGDQQSITERTVPVRVKVSDLDQLDQIAAVGTNHWTRDGLQIRSTLSNKIRCADGFTLSVIAGWGTYCSPRPGPCGYDEAPNDYAGPYFEVEVGFPSQRPEPWSSVWEELAEDYTKPTDTVYAYVPMDVVRALVNAHGGLETWEDKKERYR